MKIDEVRHIFLLGAGTRGQQIALRPSQLAVRRHAAIGRWPQGLKLEEHLAHQPRSITVIELGIEAAGEIRHEDSHILGFTSRCTAFQPLHDGALVLSGLRPGTFFMVRHHTPLVRKAHRAGRNLSPPQ